jgi:hypothetical protein
MRRRRHAVKVIGRSLYRPRGRLTAVAFEYDEDDDDVVLGGETEEVKETASSSTVK